MIVLLYSMTLTVRNNFFKGWIIIAALSLLSVAAAGYYAFSVLPDFAASAALRPQGLFQSFFQSFAQSNAHNIAQASAYVPFWTMLGAAAYSLVSIIIIYFFFEKTQAPEILFLSCFAISLSFEFARIILPLSEILSFPPIYSIVAFRSLLFGRYFGLFSLFAASVYAAGLDAQKQQSVFSLLVLAALLIAANVPVDSLIWDSTFVFGMGYNSMLSTVEMGIVLVTIFTFFVSAYIRDSRSYISIGLGIIMAFLGRNLLVYSDNWITPLPGLILLALGTWLASSRLHKIYLWL